MSTCEVLVVTADCACDLGGRKEKQKFDFEGKERIAIRIQGR
jgi:hypothetical protein